MIRSAFLLLFVLPGVAAPSLLDDSINLAAQDAARIGQPAAQRYRWLILTTKDRKAEWQVTSVHLNATSRNPVVKQPLIVTSKGDLSTGSQLTDAKAWDSAALIRVNLDDYGYSAATWDNLGFLNPQHNATFIETVPKKFTGKGGDVWFRWEGEEWVEASKWKANQSRASVGIAAHVSEAFQPFATAVQARTPVLSASNFLWQTAIQADRKVGYYGLTGVKNRNDYLKLVGLNIKDSQAYSPELLAVVSNSGVAQQPRRIARYPSLGGGVWATFDNKQAINEFNPIRFLNGGYKHAAEEWFGQLPNGFWAVALFDADGKTQDSAPDFIGYDHGAHSNDGRIHVGLSCMHCHANSGLQDIRDSIRNLYAPPQVLQGPDLKALQEAGQHYFQQIEGKMKRDRELYVEALALASDGMKPPEYALALRRMFAAYDRPVTAELAAAELGVTVEDMLMRFDAMRKTPAGLDPVLGMFLVDAAKREPIPRVQWLEAYPVAQAALRGLPVIPNAKGK